MALSAFIFDFKDLHLDVRRIEKLLGYEKEDSVEPISMTIEKILKESESFHNIRAEYRIFENFTFNISEMILKINDLDFNVGKIIFNQLRNSEILVFFLATAGEEIELKSREAMKRGDYLSGYIYNIVGSEIAEAAAEKMHDHLQMSMAPSGRSVTSRFSPGYCEWDLSEQYLLFSLFPDNFCGIRLTSSALMDPLKSVSGIIGAGSDVKRLAYPCKLCSMKNCSFRRSEDPQR